MSRTLSVSIGMVEDAWARVSGSVLRTPLVSLNLDEAPGEVFLKLENLQPTGSFKVRGVINALALAGPETERRGVYTVSAGNMAQALAWQAKRRGMPCSVIVPDNAPETKLEGIRRFGAEIVKLSFSEVWKVVVEHGYPPLGKRVFVHPFSDEKMIAGNGTIGLEVLEDLPDVDTVIVPFGGGGLATGIATAIRARSPKTRVFAVEPETASPLAASFAAGAAQTVHRVPSFVDGIGAMSVLPEMWELARTLLHGSLVVSLQEVAYAVKLLVERVRTVSEGAGAAPVAAALTGKAGSGKIAAIVSGGNIDSLKLATILQGQVP